MHEPLHNNVLLGRTRGWLPQDQQKQRWTKQTTENAKQVTHHNNHSCGTTTKLVTWTSPILWDELVVYIKVITPYPNLPDDAVVSSHGEKDNRDDHHNQLSTANDRIATTPCGCCLRRCTICIIPNNCHGEAFLQMLSSRPKEAQTNNFQHNTARPFSLTRWLYDVSCYKLSPLISPVPRNGHGISKREETKCNFLKSQTVSVSIFCQSFVRIFFQ